LHLLHRDYQDHLRRQLRRLDQWHLYLLAIQLHLLGQLRQ
jgi:hypothetical protein